jgi:hypothetical protein
MGVDPETCEHADAEDTGGPDGSQYCPDCGKWSTDYDWDDD